MRDSQAYRPAAVRLPVEKPPEIPSAQSIPREPAQPANEGTHHACCKGKYPVTWGIEV